MRGWPECYRAGSIAGCDSPIPLAARFAFTMGLSRRLREGGGVAALTLASAARCGSAICRVRVSALPLTGQLRVDSGRQFPGGHGDVRFRRFVDRRSS